jgi:NAD-dependent SIR2 family protein deacetylase
VIAKPKFALYWAASCGACEIAQQQRVEAQQKAESGLYFVKNESATTIIEINAEPTPLTAEGISDYLIRGRTAEVLPRIVEAVKKLSR